MKKAIALISAVIVLLFVSYVVNTKAKQYETETAALRQWSMEYRAIHP